MSPGVWIQRRAERAARPRTKHLRAKAWLLGALALAFYLAYYAWSVVRAVGAAGGS
jgi:hypothetical protein